MRSIEAWQRSHNTAGPSFWQSRQRVGSSNWVKSPANSRQIAGISVLPAYTL
jgi:hypothetical protein